RIRAHEHAATVAIPARMHPRSGPIRGKCTHATGQMAPGQLLLDAFPRAPTILRRALRTEAPPRTRAACHARARASTPRNGTETPPTRSHAEIGRASCRERESNPQAAEC